MTYPLATLASSENHRGCVDIAAHRSEVQKVYEQQPLDISQPISCSSIVIQPLFVCLFLSFSTYRSVSAIVLSILFFSRALVSPVLSSLFLRRRIVLGPTDHDSSYQHDCRWEKRTSVPRYRYIYICSLSSIGKWDRTRWLDFCGHPVLDMSLTDNDRLPCILFCS